MGTVHAEVLGRSARSGRNAGLLSKLPPLSARPTDAPATHAHFPPSSVRPALLCLLDLRSYIHTSLYWPAPLYSPLVIPLSPRTATSAPRHRDRANVLHSPDHFPFRATIHSPVPPQARVTSRIHRASLGYSPELTFLPGLLERYAFLVLTLYFPVTSAGADRPF